MKERTTQQQLILGELLHLLEEGGWTFTVDSQYGNTGWVRVIDTATLATLTEIRFRFEYDGFWFAQGAGMNSVFASYKFGELPTSNPVVKATPLAAIEAALSRLTDSIPAED